MTVVPGRTVGASIQARSRVDVRGRSLVVMCRSTPSNAARSSVVAHQDGQGRRHRHGRARRRRFAGEHVVDRHLAVAAHRRRALDRERRRAELPLVGRQRVQDHDVRQQRREQLVVDEVELEGLAQAALGVERRCRIGIRSGPLPSVPATAVSRSCRNVPIVSPVVAIFIED